MYFESVASTNDKTNNFLVLRLFAASLVIYGHSFALANLCSTCIDISTHFLGYRYSGDIGLHIFFVISGFLIATSFEKTNNIWIFLRNRILRIYPALIFFTFTITFLVGPVLTNLDFHSYLNSSSTYRFFLINTSLYSYFERLPGIFDTNRISGAVAGTLWTLWIEARLYLLIGLFGMIGILKRKLIANIAIGLLIYLGIFHPSFMPLIGENINHLRLGIFFIGGVFVYINKNIIPFNKEIIFILILCTFLSKNTPTYEIFFGFTIIYSTLYIAFCKKIFLPKLVQDFSYGIYLYGWTIQQIIAKLHPSWGPYQMTLVAVPLSWLCGFLSWHLIEKQFLLRKPYSKK